MLLRRFLFLLFACCVLGPPILAQEKGPIVITATTSQCAQIDVGTNNSTVGITVSGTFVMTLQPSVAIAGQTAANVQVTPSTSTTAQNTITAAGIYKAEVAGYSLFQVCASAYTSGSATIYLKLSSGVNASLFQNGATGTVTSVSGTTNQIGSTGGNTPVLSLDPALIFPGSISTGAFLADFSAGTMEIPEAAGFVANVNSTLGTDTNTLITYLWGPGGASVANVVSSNTCTTATFGLFGTTTAGLYNCRAVATGDLPLAIPIANVGSAGLSGTTPVTISAAGAIACATCVTSSSPGVGIAHFAGSTQAVTSSAVNLAGGSNEVTGALPIANVGSAGLSATGPVRIASTGVIDILGSGTVAVAQGGTGAATSAAGTFFGNQTSSTAAPSFVTLSGENAQTSTYQVLASDFSGYKTIIVASGTFTITLVASGTQPAAGQYIKIINYGTGTLTVARSGQNINGATNNVTVGAANSGQTALFAYIESDGTNYFMSNSTQNSNLLVGKNWAAPAAIGTTTPAASTFTTTTSGTAGTTAGFTDLGAGFLAAAMTAQSSATCTNITNMTWNIAANKNYILRCEIPMTLAASATIQYCLGGPGTATSFSLMADGDLGTAGIWSQISTLAQTSYGTKTNASASVAASSVQHVWAAIQNGATASGTALTLQTAANGTNNITVLANASCTLTQVN